MSGEPNLGALDYAPGDPVEMTLYDPRVADKRGKIICKNLPTPHDRGVPGWWVEFPCGMRQVLTAKEMKPLGIDVLLTTAPRYSGRRGDHGERR